MGDGLKERTAAYMAAERMLQPGDRVAAALSGGADSVCLLHLLRELAPVLNFTLQAVHVNHCLRPEADAEECWVQELCASWDIPLQCFHVDVKDRARQEGLSVEEAARLLRYQAFEQVEADKIALAHHRKDQAETVLLHLLRGSGLNGLGGMRPVRGRYIRPLLEESRSALLKYNHRNGLTWAEDASNQDTRYQRNRIRQELLPDLESFNPAAELILSRMARQLQQDEEYLWKQAEKALSETAADGGLRASALTALPPALSARVLRLFLQENGGLRDISAEHTEAVLALCRKPGNHRINLPGDLTLQKSYDILKLHKEAENRQPDMRYPEVPGWTPLTENGEGLALNWEAPPEAAVLMAAGPREEWAAVSRDAVLCLRTRRPGDYLMAAGGRKRLQDFLVDSKLPAAERDSLLLLADEAHILWVPGRRLSDGVRIRPDTREALHMRLCTREEYEAGI